MSVTRRSFLGAMTAAAGRRVLGANDRVQVGFIGYGLIGAQHVYDFKSQHDVDLAALCDVYEPRLQEGLAACGPRAKGHRDFRRLLDDRDIQVVVISTRKVGNLAKMPLRAAMLIKMPQMMPPMASTTVSPTMTLTM